MDIKKIKNFFYYNRIAIIAFLFVIVFVTGTMRQCTQRVETDLGIMYTGTAAVSDYLDGLAKDINAKVILDDIDGDGVVTVNTKSIVIPELREHMIEQQVPEQIQVEIISGENILYILDKPTLISYAVDENFADITDLAKKYGCKPDECLSYDDGKIYAIGLSNNLYLKEKGIECQGQYIAIRNYLPKDSTNPKILNAKKAAEYILKNGGR